MNKQPELHTTTLLMQPLSISFENAALQILRFSKIHENTHAWAIPLHTHPTIELHYILSGAGQIQIDDTLFHVETNDIYVTLPFVPHCQISSAADIMEEYCVECTLELPPAKKGEADPLASLRRFKDDVKEVASGYECGLQVDKYNDVKVGDVIEVFVMEEIKQ